MPELTNGEIIRRGGILFALVELGGMGLPIKGAFQVNRIRKALTAHAETIEETRLECLKKYVELDEKGEVAWQDVAKTEDKEAHRTSVYIKDEDGSDTTTREAFDAEYAELMEVTYKLPDGLGIQAKHLPRDEGGKNIPGLANLLFRLSDLVEDAGTEKKER